MAVYKCKMCGANLEISSGISVASCEFCGTTQTVPTAKDENLQGLFNRANALRLKSEFDKAEQLYEKIVEADETQAEAYWGIVLCRYGIEYVEDPVTFSRIPTCHRTLYDSVISDSDYKSALQYADASQRAVYEKEAAAIDLIQKDTLAVVESEEPYDVFICYKETDENGKRTVDSVIANDIYYQLTAIGLKVFYAAITLEDKLGKEFEPYIFAALSSAKVMLVIGTKPEYFTAPWVRNEWSRFLKMKKTDRSKQLIPCYRDMDAYLLPDEYAHLQAQDMSKIGFINDIIRGIEKVVSPEKSSVAPVAEAKAPTQNASASLESLIKRIFIFLEDKNWQSADEYCEKVLDIDPECASGYLGKLMAALNASTYGDIITSGVDLSEQNDFQKALRYADDKLKNELFEIKTKSDEYNNRTAYDKAMSLFNTNRIDSILQAKEIFDSLEMWEDSADKMDECDEKIEGIEKDIVLNEAECTLHKDASVDEINAAIEKVRSIGEWKHSDEVINDLKNARQHILDRQASVAAAKKKHDEDVARKAKAEKRKKLILRLVAVIVIIAIVASGAFYIYRTFVATPREQYETAAQLVEEGKYTEACEIYKELGKYKDSREKLAETSVLAGDFETAIELFTLLGDEESRLSIVKDHPEYAQVGDSITFGRFEQDNDLENGMEDIEWIVLKKDDNETLLISKYILDYRVFCEENNDKWNWRGSDVRNWLNGEFYDLSFNDDEKAKILVNENASGSDTEVQITDNIILLPESDLRTYKQYLSAEATPYAAAKAPEENADHWWTITSDFLQTICCGPNTYQYVNAYTPTGVCPVIRITQ